MKRSFSRPFFRPGLIALLLVATACGAAQPASSTPGNPPPAGTTVAVTVTPASTRVTTGASVSFSAVVTGTAVGTVTWSVLEGVKGGTVDGSGRYVAPASPGTFHVIATSVADPSASATVLVTVVAPAVVTVTLTPSTASTDACRTVSFSATTSVGPTSGVSWSVREGTAGGTVSVAGVYTAPSAAGTYHVVASSVDDPSAVAEATVTVGPEKVLAVAVTPGSVTTSPGGAVSFAATVTTSCGTFAAQ